MINKYDAYLAEHRLNVAKTHQGVKEIPCSSCGHLQVCSIKHTFLLVQEELDRLSINTEDGDIIRVIDMPHVSTSLKCTHWISNSKTR